MATKEEYLDSQIRLMDAKTERIQVEIDYLKAKTARILAEIPEKFGAARAEELDELQSLEKRNAKAQDRLRREEAKLARLAVDIDDDDSESVSDTPRRKLVRRRKV